MYTQVGMCTCICKYTHTCINSHVHKTWLRVIHLKIFIVHLLVSGIYVQVYYANITNNKNTQKLGNLSKTELCMSTRIFKTLNKHRAT